MASEDAIIQGISGFMPNVMLLMIIFVPFVIVGIFAVLFVVSRFTAWAMIEYGYESKNDVRTFKVNYSKDRSFLISAGIPGMDPKIGFPVPVCGLPIRMRGKPCYRYYSPEPGIFVPVSLALDREVYVGNRKNEDGSDLRSDDGKLIPIYAKIADLVPKIGFEARQAFGESYAEAEKLYTARNKLMALLATWAPIIIFVVLMLVVIVMLGNLVANLNNGVTVQCTTEAIAKAGGAMDVSAPWFS
jgi:hypothetical protein